MSDVNAPLLSSRRRLGDQVEQQVSSHNLMPRNDSPTEGEEEEDLATTDYGSGVYRYPTYLQPGHFTSLEKLFFFTSSILFILLFIFVGLYARSSQQEKEVVIVEPIPIPSKNHTKKQVTCLEPNCIITAANILQDVDTELDPCDDFYAYTCSKWKSNHLIPDVKSRIDVPSIMIDKIRHRLDQILNREFDNFLTSQQSAALPDPNAILDRQLFNKIQDFYASCMDQDQIEAASVTPLYPLFQTIRQYVPLNNNFVKEGYNQAIRYLANQNIWPLFELQVKSRDILSSSAAAKTIISINQGQVGLEDYEDEETLKVYMQTVTSILDLVFKKDIKNEFGWKSWSTIATARRIVEFEKKVAFASKKEEKKGEPTRWSVDELQQEIPHIEWSKLLPKSTTHVLVQDTHWLNHLKQDVLSDTNPRTLQMYFIWRVIWTYLPTLNQEFQIPKRRLDAQLSGIEARAIPERWETCIDLIDQSAIGVLLGRYFILDHKKHITQAKEKVEALASSIIQILKDRVAQLDWIDERDQITKREILNKLETMQFQIGYTEEIQSVLLLSEYFSDMTMNKKDFFGNVIKSNQHQVKQQFYHMGPFNQHTILNAQSVQVTYNKELNKVTVPGGLLQLPYFDIDGPNYLYFGTIGWFIGHEVMHGFDTIGRKYNSQGLFGSWWYHPSLKNLDSKLACLVSQYNEFGINGESTLNNNFADLGGLYIMEQLLLQSNTSEVRIPGLNQWSKEQLFYIQYARMKCSKSTIQQEEKVKLSSPDQFRVNGPLVNSILFSKSFHCKSGSNMNPNKKCQVW